MINNNGVGPILVCKVDKMTLHFMGCGYIPHNNTIKVQYTEYRLVLLVGLG